jgi:predicted dehydrogenase
MDMAGTRGVPADAFCYTSAVRHIRQHIADGVIGDVLYVDSVRINLGLVQPDVNVFWDLAPHDLSILDFILPSGLDVGPVTATGADPVDTGRACIGHASLPLPGGGIADISYPDPWQLTAAYSHLGYGRGTCPVAEPAAGEILSLPMFPHLTADQQSEVASALEATCR